MLCMKCGAAIPDGSEVCPLCGADLTPSGNDRVDDNTLQNDSAEFSTIRPVKRIVIIPLIGMIAGAISSLMFMSLDYMKIGVSIDFFHTTVSIVNYTGYDLAKGVAGQAKLLGIMIILLIVVNIAAIVTAIIGITGRHLRKNKLKWVILGEDIIYLISTVVSFLCISNILKGFDIDISANSIGIGCYLNIAAAVFMFIMYVCVCAFSKK